MSEPIQLISVDGELHLMPKEDGGEPIILLYRYGEGDVDCGGLGGDVCAGAWS